MNTNKKSKNQTSAGGQILLEIMIAGLVIIFISLAVAQGIASSLRGIDQTGAKTTATFLSREIVEAMRAIAIEDWHNISNLSTSSASGWENKYFVTTSAGKWIASATTTQENVILNSITYARYFKFEEVRRATSNSNIVSSGGYWDPSTSKIVTNITWTDRSGRDGSFGQTVYFSRYTNEVFPQTQWITPSGETVVSAEYPTTFATSTNVSTTTDGFLLRTN